MRELLENALYAPTAGRYKVYIIDEVHMLSRNAFNAMLKTLEEPPEHVKFVLATTDPQKIPVTVLSRCLQFNLKQIPPAQIQSRLQQVLEAEGIAYEPPALALLARAAQGSLRDGSRCSIRPSRTAAATSRRMRRARCWARSSTTYLYAILRALARGGRRGAHRRSRPDGERSLSFEMALQELARCCTGSRSCRPFRRRVADDDPDDAGAARAGRALQRRGPAALLPDRGPGAKRYRPGAGRVRRIHDDAAADARVCAGERSPASVSAADAKPCPRRRCNARGARQREPAIVDRARPKRAADQRGRASRRSPAIEATPRSSDAGGLRKRDANAWAAIVEQLGLMGMARMLAEHCELVRLDAERIELRIAAGARAPAREGATRTG